LRNALLGAKLRSTTIANDSKCSANHPRIEYSRTDRRKAQQERHPTIVTTCSGLSCEYLMVPGGRAPLLPVRRSQVILALPGVMTATESLPQDPSRHGRPGATTPARGDAQPVREPLQHHVTPLGDPDRAPTGRVPARLTW
jgi:hypothetical protein